MCGICGEIRFDNEAVAAAPIQAMLARLVHRGPDASGEWLQGSVGFGHRRLAIIDLTERANQPMEDQTHGLTIVFNGTIYNYKELRQTLVAAGYTFFSTSDTEVILKAYAHWGEDCVTHFNGMFAFAIWDARKQCCILARDRLGIKPLYFSHSAKHLRFASNPQALLSAGGVNTDIDPVGLHYQFTLHGVVPAPYTVLQGIRKLPPATLMKIQLDGRNEQRTYWQLSPRCTHPEYTEQDWNAAIHEALKQAVKRRKLASDVPVGVLLSGGLDSSLLVGLLAEQGVENLLTFSVGFEDMPEERGSEFEYSDQVVERFATQHRKLHIPNDAALGRLPDAVRHMAEPMFAQDAVAFYLLAEQVSQEVKVVMSGQGADEVFGGYFWYPRMQGTLGSDLARFQQHYFDRDHDEFLAMTQPRWHGEDHTSALVSALLAKPDAPTFLDRVLHMDVTTLIVDDPVKRVDNMTMAWGLEARVPFLDHELVELAAQMPAQLKIQQGGKAPLKHISRGLLPDAVIDRTKGYFPMPALKYVRGEFLQFMRDILLSAAASQRGLYQASYVEKLLAKPDEYLTRIQGNKLWHLALFEFWLQTHIDG